MKKFFKWLGIILGSLVGLILLAAAGLYLKSTLQLTKTHSVQVEPIQIPTDPEAIARGREWVTAECTHCHGLDLSGTFFLDDPTLATIPAPNLTSGQGGAGATFSDLDWVRAIRHGLKPDDTSLVVMPSMDFYHFSDADLGDIIAYLKSIPPVDHIQPEPTFYPVGRILVAAGAFGKIFQAEIIDHSTSRPTAPAEGMTAEYGEYIANVSGCKACHGENLAGAQSPEPGSPYAPGLGAGSEVFYWTDEDFIKTMRTGVTPSGHELGEFMPWKDFGNLSDERLKALLLYLRSQPAK